MRTDWLFPSPHTTIPDYIAINFYNRKIDLGFAISPTYKWDQNG